MPTAPRKTSVGAHSLTEQKLKDRRNRSAWVAKWFGIFTFILTALSVTVTFFVFFGINLVPNLPDFLFGKYWGIEGESWISFWGSIIGSFIAAGATVAVLYGQINHQAQLAKEDRKEQARLSEENREQQAVAASNERSHQMELARYDREVVAALNLRDATADLTGCLESNRNNMKFEELFKSYETAVYRWGVNSGLSSSNARAIIAQMVDSAQTLIEFKNGWIFICVDQAQELNTTVGEILMSVTDSRQSKWKTLEKHFNYYYDTLVPLRDKFLREFADAEPQKDRYGNPISNSISVTVAHL